MPKIEAHNQIASEGDATDINMIGMPKVAGGGLVRRMYSASAARDLPFTALIEKVNEGTLRDVVSDATEMVQVVASVYSILQLPDGIKYPPSVQQRLELYE